MGRVNRLMERRALRRAADQALLTTLGKATPSQAGGLPDQDFKYTRAEPADTDAPHDHDPITQPIPVVGVGTTEPAEDAGDLAPDDYGWPDEDLPAVESVAVVRAHADVYDLVPDRPVPPDDYGWVERDDAPPPRAFVQQPPRAYALTANTYVQPNLDFAVSDYRERHWYRSGPAAALLVAAVIGAVVCSGWLVFRSSATTVEQSRTESPTSAPPVSSKAPPAAVSAHTPPPAPAPPPAPPPPPPAAQPTYSAPQRQYSPRYSEPTRAQKPRVDVTRAPMSVAPVPKPVPGSDSNTPGDAPRDSGGGRRRGCFGFC
jgi:hypothetical protein